MKVNSISIIFLVIFLSYTQFLIAQNLGRQEVYFQESGHSPHPCFDDLKDSLRTCKKILKYTDWLASTPLNQKFKKREKVNKFIGSIIECKASFTTQKIWPLFFNTISKTNPDLYMIYWAGYLRYNLLYIKDKDEFSAVEHAFKLMLRVYQMEGANPDETLDQLLELMKEGRLKYWIIAEIA